MSFGADAERASLDHALRALAPATVVVGSRRIDEADVARLWPAELDAVANAVDTRRREFASGRVLLRLLLGSDIVIGVRRDRRPMLPEGVAAALAHDDTFVVAAVSRDPGIAVLGIDIEPARPLDTAETAIVLRPDELGIDASLAFTLKEAVYKAWSAGGGRMLEHGDVRLTVAATDFEAEVLPDGALFAGGYAFASGRWVALAMVSAGP